MAEVKIHASQVEMIPVDALKGYEKNTKSHPDRQVKAIADMVREFGWTTPLLVDDEDVIVAGHGRILVARKLKMTEVPCVRVSGLTDDQRRALRIADNKSPEMGDWLDGMLKLEMDALAGVGFDLSLTGFSALEISGLFSTEEGHSDPDEVFPLPDVPVSQAGDIWLFEGGHRIICGDCTSKETVEAVIQGQKVHLLVSDPPFGVSYSPEWRTKEIPQTGKWKSPNRAHGAVQNDERADWREAWALFPGEVAYVWHSGRHASIVQESLEACEFEIRSQIIWRKASFAVGRGHYHWQHEAAWYCVKKGGSGHWGGDRKQATVWDIEAPKKSDTGHGTQKPVEAMARPIRNNSAVGEFVYDPFMGSGTTCVAAHTNKRVAIGCEIDPVYMDVICTRMAKFTGVSPILAETGETFEAVRTRRLDVV